MSKKTDEILKNYPTLTEKQRKNFNKLLNFGRIGGTGKLVILPVDQGFEHGPVRSFQKNPLGYDPSYHPRLAVDAGCNGYAAPLGALEAVSDILKKSKLPTILKLNNHDLMMPDGRDYFPAFTGSVNDAARLGAVGVGMTVYFGSKYERDMLEQLRGLVADARVAGLIVIVWAYPRGSGLPSEEAETALDVVSYGVHLACQMGAHIVKCKPTKNLIALESNVKKKVFEGISTETLADRTKIIVQSAFAGRRMVICSGGEARTESEILDEVSQLAKGGASGSIVGRNSFQRPKPEAISLLHKIQDVYVK